MSRNMLINAQHAGQVRVAIVDETTLESYQVDVAESGLTRGNIYRGTVANIQPSLNAAFIDLGEEKHGFLSLDDTVAAAYHKTPPEGKGRPRIDQVLERKRSILVQVTKDGMGAKGPALTTNLSLAGRYLVMMPLDSVRGISRKIEDDQLRKTVKARLAKLTVPEGMGVIVRTNGLDQTQAMLNRDLNALARLWRRIENESHTGKGPRLLYNDQDLILQALRDFLDTSIEQVIVDTDSAHERAERFMATFMPRSKTELIRYDERLPLFSRYHLENQIDRIYSRSVPLPSGGSIVIDPTEALTAIDINSGRATKRTDHDESILAVNLEAAAEVGRQLRLRDIGGLVVIDFIDMRLRKHQHKVEKAMRDALKTDRARHTVSRISANGLVEINRQRLKQALRSRIHRSCPTCEGVGSIPSLEFAAISLLRRVEARAAIGNLASVVVGLHPEVADALQNNHRHEIASLEDEFDLHIEIIAAANLHRTEERVEWKKDREGGGREVDPRALTAVDLAAAATTSRRRRGGGRIDDQPDAVVAEAPQAGAAADGEEDDTSSGEARPKRRRRRGGRGRRRNKETGAAAAEAQPALDDQPRPAAAAGPAPAAAAPAAAAPPEPTAEPKPKRSRRGGRGRSRTRTRGDSQPPATQKSGNFNKTEISVKTVVTEDGYVDDDSQLRFFGRLRGGAGGAPPAGPAPHTVTSTLPESRSGRSRSGGRSRRGKNQPNQAPPAKEIVLDVTEVPTRDDLLTPGAAGGFQPGANARPDANDDRQPKSGPEPTPDESPSRSVSAPIESPPFDEPPAEPIATFEPLPPAGQPSAEQPPTEQPPTDEAPVDEAPAKAKPRTRRSSSRGRATKKSAAEKTATPVTAAGSSVDIPSVESSPVESSPVDPSPTPSAPGSAPDSASDSAPPPSNDTAPNADAEAASEKAATKPKPRKRTGGRTTTKAAAKSPAKPRAKRSSTGATKAVDAGAEPVPENGPESGAESPDDTTEAAKPKATKRKTATRSRAGGRSRAKKSAAEPAASDDPAPAEAAAPAKAAVPAADAGPAAHEPPAQAPPEQASGEPSATEAPWPWWRSAPAPGEAPSEEE